MNQQKLSAFLNFLRRVDGLTQAEIAKTTGMSRSHLSEIYSGKKNCTLEALFCIAAIHHVEVWEIIYFLEIKFCSFNKAQIQAKVSSRFFALMCIFYQQRDADE